jgi:hypothetical protein
MTEEELRRKAAFYAQVSVILAILSVVLAVGAIIL